MCLYNIHIHTYESTLSNFDTSIIQHKQHIVHFNIEVKYFIDEGDAIGNK